MYILLGGMGEGIPMDYDQNPRWQICLAQDRGNMEPFLPL